MMRMVFLGLVAAVLSVMGLLWWVNFYDEMSSYAKQIEEAASDSTALNSRYQYFLNKQQAENTKERVLVFVGDVMVGRGVASQIEKHKDFNFPFLKVAGFLQGADLVFGNLEGPISNRGTKQGSEYSFRFDPQVSQALQTAGFDVLSLANNHILDYGPEALVDTVDYLRKMRIESVGAGVDYSEANEAKILQVGGMKVAFLAYTNLYPKSLSATPDGAGISDSDPESVKEAVKSAKEKADFVVVSWHWGDEYKIRANELQRKMAREMIEAGADIVVGHHPHVPEEIEQYKQGWIFYSLGNFVFDQAFSPETMSGLLVKVGIIREGGGRSIKVEPVKFRINGIFQPYFPNLETEGEEGKL